MRVLTDQELERLLDEIEHAPARFGRIGVCGGKIVWLANQNHEFGSQSPSGNEDASAGTGEGRLQAFGTSDRPVKF